MANSTDKRSFITHTKYSRYNSDQEYKSKERALEFVMNFVEGNRSEIDVNDLAIELSDVALLWTEPARTPEHLRNWKVRLEREWPEMYDAIDRLVKRVAG